MRTPTRWALVAAGVLTMSTPVAIGLTLPSGAGAAPVTCTDSSRACVIAAATTYLNALVSHNSSEVRLAPNAIRTENAYDTGDSGPGIANDLATNPQYLLIHDIRDVRWFVDGDQAIAFYLLDVINGLQIATTHVAERFQVDSGLIQQIEAIDCTHPSLLAPEGERMPTPDPLVAEQCLGQ
jgi:hypothetical protein